MTTSKGWLPYIIPIILQIDIANATVISTKAAGTRTLTNGHGITLSIHPNSRTIILRKSNGYLILNEKNGSSIYTFVSNDSKNMNKLIFKGNRNSFKVGFYRSLNTVDYSVCAPTDGITKLSNDVEKITTASQAQGDVSSSVLDKSCLDKLTKIFQFKVKKTAQDIFSNDSYLGKCLSDKVAREKFSKIKNFHENVSLIENELANDRGLSQQGKLPITIACEDSPDPAKFNAKYKDGVIAIPVNGNMPIKNDCLNTEAALSHELLHKAGIKEEKQVAIFDAICSSVNNPGALNDQKCDSQFSMKMCVANPEKCGMAAQIATVEALKKAEKTDQKQISKTVKSEVEKASIKDIAVSEKDWNSLGSSQDTPESSKATRSIASAMSENYDKFSGAVNRTVGVLESPSYASSSSSDSSSSEPSSTSRRYSRKEKTSSGDETMYTTEEFLADKFPEVPKTSQSTLLTATEPRMDSLPIKSSGSTSVARDTAAEGKSTASKTDRIIGQNEVAGTNTGTSSNQKALLPETSSPNALTRNSGGVADRSIAQSQSSNTVTTLQRNEVVTGAAYKEITSSYDRPTFSRELAEQGVSITIASEGVTLGQKINRASLQFVDDGKSLRRVKGK